MKLDCTVIHSYFIPPQKGLQDPTTRRQRERRLKSESALFQSLSKLFLLTSSVKCRRTLLKLNFKASYPSSEKQITSRRCLFTFSTKREFRNFHVVVVQKRQGNVLKRYDARAKLLFCRLKLLFLDVLVAVASLNLRAPYVISKQQSQFNNQCLTCSVYRVHNRFILLTFMPSDCCCVFVDAIDKPGYTRQFIARFDHDCRDFNGVLNKCHVWKDLGFCFKYRREMQHVCNKTCQYCGK